MMKQTKAEAAPVSGQHTPDYTGYGGTIRVLKAMGYSLGSNNDLWWLHGGDHIAFRDGKTINVADLITELLRRCNAHDELVNALELAQATIERLHRHAPGSAQGTLDVTANALAKTTKEAA